MIQGGREDQGGSLEEGEEEEVDHEERESMRPSVVP